MKRVFGFLVIMALLLPLSGCNRSYDWHRKLTIIVDTPNGRVFGSSVVREHFAEVGGWWSLPESTRAEFGVVGEAAFVQVAPGKYLFALLSDNDARIAKPSSFHVFFPGSQPLEVASQFATLRQSRAVPVGQYPTLITFENLDYPTSVKLVDPANLTASFGDGYSLKALTLEITDEKVTDGAVENVLGWVRSPKILQNPVWASLPHLSQTAIFGLISPIEVKQ